MRINIRSVVSHILAAGVGAGVAVIAIHPRDDGKTAFHEYVSRLAQSVYNREPDLDYAKVLDDGRTYEDAGYLPPDSGFVTEFVKHYFELQHARRP